MISEPPLDAPDEEWLVWADALQQIGDPRGELLALAHRPGARDAFVRAHADALLGPVLGAHLRDDAIRVTRWLRHVPDTIELRVSAESSGPRLVVDVLRHAGALRGIAIAGIGEVDLTATLGWLRESQLPASLVRLALVDDHARTAAPLAGDEEQEPPPNRVVFGPLAPLWQAFEDQLEELTLIVADPGQVRYQGLRLPQLRAFTLRCLCWVDGLDDMLANTRWPRLRSLALELRDPFADVGEVDTARLVAWWRDLPLEHLALTRWTTATFLSTLDHPTLPALELSDSAFDHRAAELLLGNPFFFQLDRLVIERVPLASPWMLRGVGVEIIHSAA